VNARKRAKAGVKLKKLNIWLKNLKESIRKRAKAGVMFKKGCFVTF
jgi:hypothetical protein